VVVGVILRVSTDTPQRWLRASHAAAYCGVSRSTFYRWIDSGLVPETARRRVSHKVALFDRLELDAAIEKAGSGGHPA
jgi:excisionase family DNA binding protein